VQQSVSTVSQQQIPNAFQAPQHIPQIPQIPQHFFQQPMYQPAQMQYTQRMSVPTNLQPYRHGSLIETPLPSPSAFSQISADGAPSMVSDRSSISGRSPHNNGSPIELPPLSGQRSISRQPAVPQYNFNNPNMFTSEADFHVPTMQITRFEEQHKQPQMLQEPFMPAQQHMYAMQQPQYMQPTPPRQPSPMQQYQMQQQYQQQQAPQFIQQRSASYQISPLPVSVQLPSINDLSTPVQMMQGKPHMSLEIDPALMHGTPIPSVHTPDGSPKDKMSLSNITL